MKTFYRILRFTLVSLIVLPVVVPFIIYISVSLPGVQHFLSERIGRELTELLGSEVAIGEIDVAPFNRILLKNLKVCDEKGNTALSIDHLGAGVNIIESLWHRRLTITYVELIGMDLSLYRPDPDSPLNIQSIIDRFQNKDREGKSEFDLALNLIVIRRSSFSYDVLDRPESPQNLFDLNHIKISDIKADITAPIISSTQIKGQIKRLKAYERSGLRLEDLTLSVDATSDTLMVTDFMISTEKSNISVADFMMTSPLSPDFKTADCLLSVLELNPDSYINLSELSYFKYGFKGADIPVGIKLSLEGSLDDIVLNSLALDISDIKTALNFRGDIRNLDKGISSLSLTMDELSFFTDVPTLSKTLNTQGDILSRLSNKLMPFEPMGSVSLNGTLDFNPVSAAFDGILMSDCGDIEINMDLKRTDNGNFSQLSANIISQSFDPQALDPALKPMTDISFTTEVSLAFDGKKLNSGYARLSIDELVWNSFKYEKIESDAILDDGALKVSFNSDSKLLDAGILLNITDINANRPASDIDVKISNLSLAPLLKDDNKYRNYNLSLQASSSLEGYNADDVTGSVKFNKIVVTNNADSRLSIDSISLRSAIEDSVRSVYLKSSLADAALTGRFSFKTLASDLKNIVSAVYPSLFVESDEERGDDEFYYDLNLALKEDSIVSRFLNLPVEIIYPVTLSSSARGGNNAKLSLDLDVPYLKNKDKLIEETKLSLTIDSSEKLGIINAHTLLPTKNGLMSLNIHSDGGEDVQHTGISWEIDRQAEFKGNIDFISKFQRSQKDNKLLTAININESRLVFSDSAWTVNPGEILISPQRIKVNNLSGGRGEQRLSINGIASSDSTDRLVVKLERIDLDYIFETLDISDAVQFGGRATGDFFGIALLSKEPILYTPKLFVKGLKYNGCVMGDGDIMSHWDNENKSVSIHAVIDQENHQHSLIDGFIKPATEELDFRFSAHEAPVGFMLPFMAAFTSEIAGEVSGDAHLFGTFKDIDMIGDIFVKDLSMKLDFTNTTYTTTDSIHITPGLIKFDDVKLTDSYGQTANMSGYVTHNYFHDPTFSFNVKDAVDFLVYDVSDANTEDPWYGKIFGNGSANVTGVPGHVDINVAMTTAPNSTFTFVISDAEQALDYTFITLRDRNRHFKDSIASLDPTPLIVRKMRERINSNTIDDQSVYTMTFEVDVTPSATMNLVMDPVGGDKITAHGSGHVRMTYSSDGDLRMYGDYTISQGSYNFTLQDIIIKDFTIREGSKISFLGDPYAAQLDITASYSLNANLSDLDESFLEDRELNRTNVPVDALMMVKGDMRQPDISFDLEFPTLNSDTYRKVRSIVSTDDMMNRQIIYLLALNKFYTPDYMTATHGNELVSVASSTISSRIASMLGQLSNNWSIAPTIRSDRGDFSDVEVDLALSSHLLNNRLLFNGNFGYRDKSMNNNSFIGDFDIRYLLNRAGTLQLKAYNRYNDQNYYLKSATTTQGVGIVFKRDFDNLFSFLRPKRK